MARTSGKYINKYEKQLDRVLYNGKVEVKTLFFNAGNYSISRLNILISLSVSLFWTILWIYNLINMIILLSFQ